MKYEVYTEIKATDDLSIIDFISIGKKGHIIKRIEFSPTAIPEYFNLAFGDIDSNGEIDDFSISNNGDRNKILATVAFAIDIYLTKYPEKWVYIKGSTRERTRLYRMAIGLNFNELTTKFEIYAEQGNTIVPFHKNMEIKGFLIKKKCIILQHETATHHIQKRSV
jgi:hypothetical protein